MTTCPVTTCDVDDLIDAEDLQEHLYDHSAHELAATIVRLAGAASSAIANTECQICGIYGATPGDHPLCDSCEKDVRG